MPKVFDSAIADISAALRMKRVWLALASEDISDQHRRTSLGPLWLLINYLAFALTFIFVLGRGEHVSNYPAYVAVGLLVWFYIMEVISQSLMLFVREESFIKGTTLPLSVYVMRLAAQSLIRAGYAALGCLLILFVSGVGISPAWGWSALGIAIVMLTAPAAIILCAFLGAYFPDSQYIISNLMRIGMFLTPVFWIHTGNEHGARALLYYWNPFTYFLEIVRVPILSGDVPMRSLLLCAVISLCAWIIALGVLGRYRKEVVFVL